jgi:transcriptional regulator with PAS, ATPase and Fis domain
MPAVKLTEDAKVLLSNYYWNGNVRQLKNITEQISVIEQQREINSQILRTYLPKDDMERLPALFAGSGHEQKSFNSEREILYQVLFDMKKDMNDLKKLVHDIMNGQQPEGVQPDLHYSTSFLTHNDTVISGSKPPTVEYLSDKGMHDAKPYIADVDDVDSFQMAEEYHDVDTQKVLTLEDMERQMIKLTLEKHRGRRKAAAVELNISERTLYRKIKEYGLE